MSCLVLNFWGPMVERKNVIVFDWIDWIDIKLRHKKHLVKRLGDITRQTDGQTDRYLFSELWVDEGEASAYLLRSVPELLLVDEEPQCHAHWSQRRKPALSPLGPQHLQTVDCHPLVEWAESMDTQHICKCEFVHTQLIPQIFLFQMRRIWGRIISSEFGRWSVDGSRVSFTFFMQTLSGNV